MTLGVSVETPQFLAQQMNAARDGRDAARRSGVVRSGGSLEIRRTVDPSHGVNAMGGSSYTPGLPLLPSNAGLAGTGLSNVRDVNAGSLTWYEAMNYVPPVSAQSITKAQALEAAPESGFTWVHGVGIVGVGVLLYLLMRHLDG